MNSLDLLDALIAFPTVSRDPNRALIEHCAKLLRDVGAKVTVIEADGGKKANLYATIGPRDRPGVLLSGHTDVVPIDGQVWTVPAFKLTRQSEKLYGRGTADMKGFVASAVSTALEAASQSLTTPLHLALSHDEEIGCVGVHSLLEQLADAPFQPLCCLVGEPTSMRIATGHKGKLALRATCRGRAAHSALAPDGLNAIHLACELVQGLRDLQAELASHGACDSSYGVSHTTVHVGRLDGGVAPNIVPDTATLLFEIRHLAQDDAEQLLQRVHAIAEALAAPHRQTFAEAAIEIELFNRYPGLDTPADAAVVALLQALTEEHKLIKVDFGTEGGLFYKRLGIPTVVCGPGSMAQGHKPDEYIEASQLAHCDAVLKKLVQRLTVGL